MPNLPLSPSQILARLNAATGTLDVDQVTTPIVQAASSAGLALKNSGGTTVATIGAGPGTGTTFAGQVNGTSFSASGSFLGTTLNSNAASNLLLQYNSSTKLTIASAAATFASGVDVTITSGNLSVTGTGTFTGTLTTGGNAGSASVPAILLGNNKLITWRNAADSATNAWIYYNTSDQLEFGVTLATRMTVTNTRILAASGIAFAQVDAATAASVPGNFSATHYVPFVANGTTYYMPVSSSTW